MQFLTYFELNENMSEGGPTEVVGTLFFQAVAGSMTMAGALATLFIDGSTNAQKHQGGVAIDIDSGV